MFSFIVIVDVCADFYQIGIDEPTVDGVPCHPIHVIDGERRVVDLSEKHAWCMYEPMRILVSWYGISSVL